MERLLLRWLSLALLLVVVVGETVNPANFTTEPDSNDPIKLSLSEGDSMVPLSDVLGLTDDAKSNILPTGISGTVFLADANNQLDLKSDQIAIISCDPVSGFIQANAVFSAAVQKPVKAVLLYSLTADYCDLQNYNGDFQWVFSMMSKDDANQMMQAIQIPRGTSSGRIYATIGYPGSVRVINGTDSSAAAANGGDSNDKNDNKNDNWTGRSTTAVAMIILYSITGLITALFLIIIITGAFRAHRHPERYGPRNVNGRQAQSRAKGLARAFLDTLPIVKTGERGAPKPGDVELAENVNNREGQESTDTTRDAATGTVATQDNQTNQARHSVEGIAAATDNAGTTDAENLGCSICTEDFEVGQDQRVLPCDHRFHPECVDPWLLNVSGTCPLCRIDLRPGTSQTSETGERDDDGNPVLQEGEFEPPPLGRQEPDGGRRASVRQSIVLSLMGIGRPDRLTREERVLALRQLRGQQLARQRREEQAAVAETPEERTRVRRRLRDVLGIRTRRTTTAPHDEQRDDTVDLESREDLGSRPDGS